MTNTRRGHDTERRCVRELELAGYECIRSAASKKTWDVIAIGPYDVKLIQCKRVKDLKGSHATTTPQPIIDKIRAAVAPNSASCVSKELWLWVDRKGWTVTIVV